MDRSGLVKAKREGKATITISSKQYKKKIKRGGSMLNGTTYSSYDYWFGVRLWKIDQSRTLEGLR